MVSDGDTDDASDASHTADVAEDTPPADDASDDTSPDEEGNDATASDIDSDDDMRADAADSGRTDTDDAASDTAGSGSDVSDSDDGGRRGDANDVGSPSDAANGADGTGQGSCDVLLAGFITKSVIRADKKSGTWIADRPAEADYVTNRAQRFSARSGDFVAFPSSTSTSSGRFGQPKSGRATLKVMPFLLTNVSNSSGLGNVELQLSATNNLANGTIKGNDSVTVQPGRAKEASFTARIKQHTASSFAGGTLDRFGTLTLELKGLQGTRWADASKPNSISHPYAVPLSSLLKSVGSLISTTSNILSVGLGASLAITTAAKGRVLLSLASWARDFVISEITGRSPVRSGTDFAMLIISKGLLAFEKTAKQLPGTLRDEADWEGRAGVSGQFLIRKANCPTSGGN